VLNRDVQRQLAVIERQLAADDPMLAARLQRFDPAYRTRSGRWMWWTLVALAALAAAAVIGNDPAMVLSIVGAVIFICAWWRAWRAGRVSRAGGLP
jgi:hypothetical protein